MLGSRGFCETSVANSVVLTLGQPHASGGGVGGLAYTVWEMRRFTPLFSFPALHVQDVRFTQGFLLATVSTESVARVVGREPPRVCALLLLQVDGPGIARMVWSDSAVLVDYTAIDRLDDFAVADSPSLRATRRANAALRAARWASLGRDGPDGLASAKLDVQAAIAGGALVGYRLYNVFSGEVTAAVVLSVVPGSSIQLVDVLHGRLFLKLAGHALRSIDLCTGFEAEVGLGWRQEWQRSRMNRVSLPPLLFAGWRAHRWRQLPHALRPSLRALLWPITLRAAQRPRRRT